MTKPSPAARQPAGFVDRDGGHGIDLERRADLVGQVVDEVQLAIAVEGLAGERSLVGLTGGGVRQHRGDGAGRPRALDPADGRALDGDGMALDRRVGWRAPDLAVEDDLAVEVW